MTGKLLLTGANGRTGRAILKSLVRANIPVRAFIRSEAQGPGLLELGASDYALGDMDDAASLAKAAQGVQQILHIGPPMHPRELDIMDAVIAAAKSGGAEHLIYYSVMHPLARAIRHHRLKLDSEERLIDSGLTHTILQPSRYMQHLEAIWPKVVETGVHAMPFSTTQKFSVVDLGDLADACSAVAMSDRYAFGTYELAGPDALSQDEMAAIIAEVIGRPVRARAIPIPEMRENAAKAGAGEDRIAQMEIMNTHYDQHGFRSNAVILQSMLGRPATSFRAYVRRLAREKGTIA